MFGAMGPIQTCAVVLPAFCQLVVSTRAKSSKASSVFSVRCSCRKNRLPKDVGVLVRRGHCAAPTPGSLSPHSLTACSRLRSRGSERNSKSVPEDLQKLAPEQGLAAVERVLVEEDLENEGHVEEGNAHDGLVRFKDLEISAEADEELEVRCASGTFDENLADFDMGSPLRSELSMDSSPGSRSATPTVPSRHRRASVRRQKLVIILVGLPARGKTFLCNKLMRYFNWLGHPTKHINVGTFRRQATGPMDAEFFDPNNARGSRARHEAFIAALEDMEGWLAGDEAQVAILDATNSTSARRNYLRDRLHGKYEYMFLESVCSDQKVLEENYRLKMKYSPDYRDVSMDAALADFKTRIKMYESAYETITDRTLHYVKLIDMVTGRGHMDVNRISGYIPGKMVFYLMQICKALGRSRKIWLTRHGQSQYNVQGKVGGNSNLSTRGAAYTHILPEVLASRVPSVGGKAVPVAVWTSTLNRTIATASNLPYPKVRWKALDEIQSGVCDGLTYAEIKDQMPEEYEMRKKDKLRYRYPSGESYMDVIQRLEPVVIEVERDRECICIVAHQAVLRALYAYFMNRPLSAVPYIDIPLHTLIELAPKADGTMAETRFLVDVDKALKEMEWIELELQSGIACKSDESQSEGSSDKEDEASIARRVSEGKGGFRRSLSLKELAEHNLVVKSTLPQ
jgi:6-phosphofructo-2-kinase/fructose-2,6-biphosphatase